MLDTALALQIRAAGEIVVAGARGLVAALAERAREHVETVCVGRTHGVQAEPTTFGIKLAGFAFEAERNARRLQEAFAQASVGALSGAVGTYSATDPDFEARVLARLGLAAEDVSTQVVPRDRHAHLLQAISLAGAGLERLATEIRHLQRTEVREAEEPFRSGQQKGSSAMPHKRNPIVSERICGLARVLRGNAQAAVENVALWHERDISHSGAERVILPDATILLDYMQHLAMRVVRGLVVHPDRMRANLEITHGALFSQRVLLALVEQGLQPRRGLPDRAGGRPARVGQRHPAARAAGARASSGSTSTRSSTSRTTRATPSASSGASTPSRSSPPRPPDTVSRAEAARLRHSVPVESHADTQFRLPDEFSTRLLVRRTLWVVALLVVIALIAAFAPGLGEVRRHLSEAAGGWIAVAILLEFLSGVSYVAMFRPVFCMRASWRTSWEIGWSELAVGSIVPASGAGGLALGAWILGQNGMPAEKIARRSVAFFLVKSPVNFVAVAVIGTAMAVGLVGPDRSLLLTALPAALSIATIGFVVRSRAWGRGARPDDAGRVRRAVVAVRRAVIDGTGEAVRIVRAGDLLVIAGALGYWAFDNAVLWATYRAFDVSVPLSVILMGYLIGQLGGRCRSPAASAASTAG